MRDLLGEESENLFEVAALEVMTPEGPEILELPRDAEAGGEMMPLARRLTGGKGLEAELRARELVMAWLRQALEESRGAEAALKEGEPWRSVKELLRKERSVLELELKASERRGEVDGDFACRFCADGAKALQNEELLATFVEDNWQAETGWMGAG